MPSINLSIILPIHNEGKTLVQDINNINKQIISKYQNIELIIIEDGLKKKNIYIEKFKKKKFIKYFSFKKKIGYKQSIKYGLEKSKYKNIFLCESGKKYKFKKFNNFIKKYNGKNIISGFRFPRYDSRIRQILTLNFNSLLRKIFNLPFQDIDSGYKVLPKLIFVKLWSIESFFNNFMSSEMMIRAYKKKIEIIEIKIPYYERIGASKQFNFLKIIFKVCVLMIDLIILYKQLKKK